MCGLTVVLDWQKRDNLAPIKSSINSIQHRGPDDTSYFCKDEVSMGFCRLSIVDLEFGAQPMTDDGGRFTIVFNGEIYNAPELRFDLEQRGAVFASSHSDTEVILLGFREYGLDFIPKLNGMFAFIIWDNKNKTLYAVRDRFGIKPLYFSTGPQGQLVFSSEIKGILNTGLLVKQLDPLCVREYFSVQDNWGTRTIFKGVQKLDPGTVTIIRDNLLEHRSYWNLNFQRAKTLSFKKTMEIHKQLLDAAVKRNLIADTDISAYLSGGIDSSAIVAIAKEQGTLLSTYSCIFDLENVGEDNIRDERNFSRQAAAFLGTNHSEFELSPQEYLNLNYKVANTIGFPHMGPSYENYFMAKLVSENGFKVVLSGLGGDEFHGGYLYRYKNLQQYRDTKNSFFKKVLNSIQKRKFTKEAVSCIANMMNFPLNSEMETKLLSKDFLRATTDYSFYDNLDLIITQCPTDDVWDLMMFIDSKTYLPGLLSLEDSLSMANSLEARVPLLDNELVDFCLSVPWEYLVNDNQGKQIFRDSVRGILPSPIVNKDKMGFAPPEMSWYRGQLKNSVKDCILSSPFLVDFFNRKEVENLLNEHFSGSHNHQNTIWSLVTFFMFLDQNQAGEIAA